MLFILEGPDGVGKTTLINNLKKSKLFEEILKRFGKKVVYIRNPLPFPWKSDADILEQRNLYLHLVEKLTRDDTIIISDRSPHSLAVYNRLATDRILDDYKKKLRDITPFYNCCISNPVKKKDDGDDFFGDMGDLEKKVNAYGAMGFDVSIHGSETSVERMFVDFVSCKLLEEEKKTNDKRILRVGGMPGRGKSTFVDNLVMRLKRNGYNVCHLQEQVGLLLRGDINALKRFGLTKLDYTDGEKINKIVEPFFPSNEVIDNLLYHYDYIVMDFAEYVRGVFIGKDAGDSLSYYDKLVERPDVKDIVALSELPFTKKDDTRPEDTMNEDILKTMSEIANELGATLLEDIKLERDSDWVSWFEEFMKT